jgi:predicted TPR repeat methyltransferase
MADTPPLAGQVVVFVGTLARLARRDATARVQAQHGRVAASVSRDTTLLVVAEPVAEALDSGQACAPLDARRLTEAQRWNARQPGRVRIVRADEFYRLAGLDTGADQGEAAALYGVRTVRGLHPSLREDRLRYLERWGLIRPVRVGRQERHYSFADLAVLRQASAELARGIGFRTVVRDLLAERQGQLTLDFQPVGETTPAKVIALSAREPRGNAAEPAQADEEAQELATAYFEEGAELDTGDAPQREAAMDAYRRALALEPSMTAALVNLANLHYARDHIVEAEALYERALGLDPTCFEAHYNLGNVYHDSGRYELAARRYQQALAIDPAYADAHFYYAVTLEKLGRSADARPHWLAYQKLAPEGEWVDLAREFSE